MKHTIIVTLIAMTLLSFVSPAIAKKPVDNGNGNGIPFGNGFPSGEHYNLNIIGKKDNFTCPAPKYDPCNLTQQIYGNVIFIPRVQDNIPIEILMESGKKGPKGAQLITDLQVTDWCTESFPDNGSGDADGAVLRLPAHDKGYAVYVRITGKPGEDGDPNVTISGSLVYVEDEAGNDLILLGLVDKDNVSKFTSDANTIYRTSVSTSTKGKGVQRATNLTALFEWTGEICYVQADSDLYCLDEDEDYVCELLGLCCIDDGNDGVFEDCNFLEGTDGVGIPDPCDPTSLICPLTDPCGVPYVSVTAECRSYENEWVFNIADFVGYLWDIDSSGAYVIQVRFYKL